MRDLVDDYHVTTTTRDFKVRDPCPPIIPPPSSPCFLFICDLDNHHQLNF